MVSFRLSRAALMAVLIGMAAVSFPAAQAHATDAADLSTALQTLPLLNNKLSGETPMAIVYDPANAASKADADSIKAAVGAGFDAPGAKVTGTLVAIADASAQLSKSKLAFIAKGSCNDAVSSAAASANILSMTTDLDCVKSNKVILGVVSKPNVEIYYSKTASDAANIGFSRAFTMLVKKI